MNGVFPSLQRFYDLYHDISMKKPLFMGQLYFHARALTYFIMEISQSDIRVSADCVPKLRRNLLFLLYVALTEDFTRDFAEGIVMIS